eukprot:scaffold48651_cov57-Phaeocystis_antarctica.AAC.6
MTPMKSPVWEERYWRRVQPEVEDNLQHLYFGQDRKLNLAEQSLRLALHPARQAARHFGGAAAPGSPMADAA